MSGKIVLVALVLILTASGTSIALQAATGRVEAPSARQAASGTPAPLQTEDVGTTPEATDLVMTPDFADCLPIEATPEATVAATEAATPISTFVATATPDCFPATPDVAFTPEATPDDFIATLDATDDDDGGQGRGRGRGRGRGGDDDDDDDSGSGNSGRGGGDDD